MNAPFRVSHHAAPICLRQAAAAAFFHAWSLLLLPTRSPELDADLLSAATTCAELLALLDDAHERVRGAWLMARVYTALGRHMPALVQARRAEDLAAALALNGTMRFRTRAALACACDHLGDRESARHWLELAAATVDTLDGPDAIQARADLTRLRYHHG